LVKGNPLENAGLIIGLDFEVRRLSLLESITNPKTVNSSNQNYFLHLYVFNPDDVSWK